MESYKDIQREPVVWVDELNEVRKLELLRGWTDYGSVSIASLVVSLSHVASEEGDVVLTLCLSSCCSSLSDRSCNYVFWGLSCYCINVFIFFLMKSLKKKAQPDSTAKAVTSSSKLFFTFYLKYLIFI